MKVLELPGDPYAAGHVHGRLLAREIRENLALYRDCLERAYDISFQEGLRRAKVHWERLSTLAPWYLPGLLGLVKGAGLTKEEVAFLDARYELFYAEFAKEGGCTALVLQPPKVEVMVLAQNWDWLPGVRGSWMHYPLKNTGVLAFTEAGILGGKLGLTAAGLGFCFTGLVSPEDRWDGDGVPLHARLWRAFRAHTVAEAQEILSTTPSPCSAAFLVGDGKVAVCVELSPSQSRILPIAGESFVHTNHFLLFPWRAGTLADWENSRARQARAETLVNARPRMHAEEVFQVLSDHQGFPHSICRHSEERLPFWEQWSTDLAVVLVPSLGECWFTSGPPCSSPWQKVSLRKTRQEVAEDPRR